MQWRAESHGRFLRRFWDDEWVVFDTASGDTHLLNLIAGESLGLLEQEALSAHGLAERLFVLLEIPVDQEFTATAAKLLSDFHELGLIEPVDT